MIDVNKYEKVGEFKNGRLHWTKDRDINAVYLIMFKDEFYIGSAEYVYMRIKEHVNSFLHNKHTGKMQAAFDKTGMFDVYIIEKGINIDDLISREMVYIRKLKPTLNTVNNQNCKNRIRDILATKGMTQKKLAEKLGMSIQQLNNTISGRNTASMAVFERIAEALDVEFWQLFAPEDVGHISGVALPKDELIIKCDKCGSSIKIKIEQETNQKSQ